MIAEAVLLFVAILLMVGVLAAAVAIGRVLWHDLRKDRQN